ncbi:MAG: TRAP transporter substrate-binding protein [Hyphomicrobiaceae bacterium]|nr:TRAP transporter substrate-binding protein [Hyphomicrobiaceae bacterium]
MRLTTALGALAAFGLVAIPATDSEAQKRVRWKMQSAFGSSLPHLGDSGVRYTKTIDELSGGRFKIKFHEPGALVPALECFDAASKGSVDACWTTPGYHAGKFPAVSFFTAVPFGPGFGEFLAWKWFGNGGKIRDELYAKHGLVAFDNFCIGPETSGWFKQEIKGGVDSLKGMKMRFFGLGAKVMQKLGVSTQLLAGADIYPALEKGVIDATEFSMPTIDIKLGFYQIAKYNYFPGWHQQTSCSEILMNKKGYEALPKTYQAMLRVAAGESVAWVFAQSEAKNPIALGQMKSKYGVNIRRWSDEDLAKFEKAWLAVIQEESAKDALFKKVADDYLAFRKTYRIWGDAQALKGTYQK